MSALILPVKAIGRHAGVALGCLALLLSLAARATEDAAIHNATESAETTEPLELTPALLEASSARIGSITIENGSIFDLDKPEENKALYRLANRFHVSTRPEVIQQQLLFQSGDTYSSQSVEETERILRGNRYIQTASIQPIGAEVGVVDLRVTTTDVWTLVPRLSLSRSGGVEIMLSQGSSAEALLWWLSYSWSEVRDSVATGTLQRSWNQSHTGKAGLSWRWKAWDFSAAAEVHTGWPRTELAAETTVNPDGSKQLRVATTELNARQYSAFHTLDARVSRDFDVQRGDLTVFLEITNLYNRRNTCCIEYALQTDADGSVGLQSRDTHWLPLLPSLGVVWRF